jgi:hypothetical protein
MPTTQQKFRVAGSEQVPEGNRLIVDVSGRIAGLPFLPEQAKRNILGETARKRFRLECAAIVPRVTTAREGPALLHRSAV